MCKCKGPGIVGFWKKNKEELRLQFQSVLGRYQNQKAGGVGTGQTRVQSRGPEGPGGNPTGYGQLSVERVVLVRKTWISRRRNEEEEGDLTPCADLKGPQPPHGVQREARGNPLCSPGGKGVSVTPKAQATADALVARTRQNLSVLLFRRNR